MPTNSEIAIVGAGPAGLCAAIEAARAGATARVIGEDAQPGGQLFKQIHKFFGSQDQYAGMRGFQIAEQLLEDAEEAGVQLHLGATLWGTFGPQHLVVARDGLSVQHTAKRLILAIGAAEKVVAFPGWTLPGVMGAGAVQTLVNIHRVLPGRRVLMIGSGNVGLIASYQLLQAGAEIVGVLEAAPQIGGYEVHARKLLRLGIRICTSMTVHRALGRNRVQAAVIGPAEGAVRNRGGDEPQKIDVDLICLAVGMRPRTDLSRLLGCALCFEPALGGFVPLHNDRMETTVQGVYVTGDAAGVEEAGTAMEEGRLAGVAAAAALGKLTPGKAAKRICKISKRLETLRSGPGDIDRRTAKERIVARLS